MNPTRTELGLGAGFIFHPLVHLKPEKNPKPEKNMKNPKETNLQNSTDTRPDRFRCQISPAGSGVKFNTTTFFHGAGFDQSDPDSTRCHPQSG
jgi:hypothetical protein